MDGCKAGNFHLVSVSCGHQERLRRRRPRHFPAQEHGPVPKSHQAPAESLYRRPQKHSQRRFRLRQHGRRAAPTSKHLEQRHETLEHTWECEETLHQQILRETRASQNALSWGTVKSGWSTSASPNRGDRGDQIKHKFKSKVKNSAGSPMNTADPCAGPTARRRRKISRQTKLQQRTAATITACVGAGNYSRNNMENIPADEALKLSTGQQWSAGFNSQRFIYGQNILDLKSHDPRTTEPNRHYITIPQNPQTPALLHFYIFNKASFSVFLKLFGIWGRMKCPRVSRLQRNTSVTPLHTLESS